MMAGVIGISACTPAPAASGEADAELDLLFPALLDSWDVRTTSSYLFAVQLLVNEPLIALTPDGSFEPALAESVESPDRTTYVYTLRDGVKFSDGTPLTAEDILYTFDLHRSEDTSSLMARYMTDIASVEATGDDEVTVSLSAPNPDWPYTVARMGIVNAAHYEASGDNVGTAAAPQLGTGPYVIADMSAGTSVELERNDVYWGEEPLHDAINLEAPTDDNARLLALQSGDYDGILLPPLSQLPTLSSVPGYTLTEVPNAATYRVSMDVTKAPFDDPAVRRAIAHAVDRSAMLDAAFSGHGTIANALVPEDILVGAGDGDAVEEHLERYSDQFEYDLDAAAAELSKSGSPDGFAIEVLVRQSDPPQSLIAQILAQSLAEIGIEVTVRQVDDNTFTSTNYIERSGDGLVVDSWNGGSPEPANMPRSAFTPGVVSNVSQFDSPAVTQAFADYNNAESEESRQTLLLEMLDEIHSQTPYVPILHPSVATILADDLKAQDFTSFWWTSRIDEIIVPVS